MSDEPFVEGSARMTKVGAAILAGWRSELRPFGQQGVDIEQRHVFAADAKGPDDETGPGRRIVNGPVAVGGPVQRYVGLNRERDDRAVEPGAAPHEQIACAAGAKRARAPIAEIHDRHCPVPPPREAADVPGASRDGNRGQRLQHRGDLARAEPVRIAR